jgi:hypothetical protein
MLIIKKIVNIGSNNEVKLSEVITDSCCKDVLNKRNLVEKILFIDKVLPGLSLHDEKILIIGGKVYSKNILHFTKLSKDNIPLGFKEIYLNAITYGSYEIDEIAKSFLQKFSEKNIKCEYNKRHNDNYRSKNTESNWTRTSYETSYMTNNGPINLISYSYKYEIKPKSYRLINKLGKLIDK